MRKIDDIIEIKQAQYSTEMNVHRIDLIFLFIKFFAFNVFYHYLSHDHYLISFKSLFHLIVVDDDDSNNITYLLCDVSRS
jgi:hypothetical protein